MIHSPAISSTVQTQNYPYPTIPLKKKYPRVHRIVLDSSDADIMPYGDDLCFKVNLPQELKSENAMLYVESFNMVETTLNNVLELKPYKLHLRGLQQPLSYHSTSKTTSDVLVTLKSRSYMDSYNKFGTPLIDKRFFKNSSVSLYFTSNFIEDINQVLDEFILTLVIAEEGD